jgi:glycosyltransferase involved in cell wall biosynthesis
MSFGTTGALPAPRAGCRITVCIPARDEAALIGTTLAALGAQRTIQGEPLPRDFFDVIVFANNCTDGTAAVVRRVAARTPQVRIFALEGTLHGAAAHIGTARKSVLDIAAERFLRAGRPDGIIASIDSDTLAAEHWIGWIDREMRGRDAVAGHVTIAEIDQERLLAPVRLLYARELTYRRVLAEVEALIDPLPEDPQPRHSSFVGASFAVTSACYFAAGGLPPRPRLEDVAFSHALRRIDARIRHSPHVRAFTSARLSARVDGGFGTFIAGLHHSARRGESFCVEHPEYTLENLKSRAALRRIWLGEECCDDRACVAAIFRLPPQTWLPQVDPAAPLGTVYERIARRAQNRRRRYPEVRVEEAIEQLRAAASDAKAHLHVAAAAENIARGSLDAG